MGSWFRASVESESSYRALAKHSPKCGARILNPLREALSRGLSIKFFPIKAQFRNLSLALSFCFANTCLGEIPSVDYVFPSGGKQGSTFDVSVGGKINPWPLKVWTDSQGLTFRTNETKGKFIVEISTNAPIGPHLLRFFNQDGASALRGFVVGHINEQLEKEPNDTPGNAQAIDKLPTTINGRFEKADDSDSFAITLEQGQWLVASVDAYSIDSPLDPVLYLLDRDGTKVAYNHDGKSLDPVLAYHAEKAGKFILQLGAFAYPPRAEVRFTGSESAVYRLTISNGPVARYAYPGGVQRGKKTSVHLFGWNLGKTGDAISQEVDATSVGTRTQQIGVTASGVENSLTMTISDAPEELEVEPNNTFDSAQVVSIPCVINGRINPPGDQDRFVFKAKAGDQFDFRVESQKFGFPLDAELKVESPLGKELARADDTGRSADSELHWSAPSDGTFAIAIQDLIRRGGSDYVYRLQMLRPKPDYKAVVEADSVRLEAGKTADLKVNVSRLNGFGESLVAFADGMPAGISSTTASLPVKSGEVILKLSATEDAKSANQSFRVLIISPNLDSPQVRVGVAKLKDKNAAAGDLLINETEDIWLTVIPKPTAETKPDDKQKPKDK